MKVRASKTGNGANVALAYQGKMGDYGKWLFGAEVAGLGDKNIPKYGVQLDLNLWLISPHNVAYLRIKIQDR